MAAVKRIPLGEKGEKVVVEQAVTVSGGHQDFFSKYILMCIEFVKLQIF